MVDVLVHDQHKGYKKPQEEDGTRTLTTKRLRSGDSEPQPGQLGKEDKKKNKKKRKEST